MGKCPNCGASYLLSTPSEKCDWCGKVTCKKCVPEWIGWLSVKSTMETEEKEAEYLLLSFCSEFCSESFWQIVMDYPLVDIGTDIQEFGENLRSLFYSAVLNALNSNISQKAINLVNWAIANDTKDYRAILVDLGDNGLLDSKCGLRY